MSFNGDDKPGPLANADFLSHLHMSPEQNRPRLILIVDDDPFVRETMRGYLCAAGMEVRTAEDANAMHGLLKTEAFDLITLDVLMPGEDGLSACRSIRRSGNQTPIIMVTGKSEHTDRIVGLEVGADDYLSKPLNLRELQARISAVLRRTQSLPATPASLSSDKTEVIFGACRLDLESCTLHRDGQFVRLSRAQFALLQVFTTHPREVLSRETLTKLTQMRPHRARDRSLDLLVARLRQLIEVHVALPKHIQTIWGKGYVFVPED